MQAHLDERVQLLITTNGKLQVTRCDTLHLHSDRGCELPEFCATSST